MTDKAESTLGNRNRHVVMELIVSGCPTARSVYSI
jgi:hypothetical protein